MGQVNISFLKLISICCVSLILFSCQRKPELAINEKIYCNLEQISDDGNFFVANSHPDKFFKGTAKLTSEFSRSGNNAILLKKGRSFGLNYKLKNTNFDEYYSISVWRKGDQGHGQLVVADEHGKLFYKATNIADSIDENGWERLNYSFYIPPNFNHVHLSIYLHNPEEDSVYFDDISIQRFASKPYPNYPGLDRLNIFVDTLDKLKLMKKREEAFDQRILKTADNDWVEGLMFHGDEMYRTELRLKGDWLDHLLDHKWSFRIEVKDDQTWSGMRTFSVQNPITRDFLNEWLLHVVCNDEDILATRYGFIPFSFNNKSLGIYAWEEHFEKYLVEYNSRREGPILKVNENALWEASRLRAKYQEECIFPVVDAAEILPFKTKRTTRDTALYRQYLIAQELYHQYKYALKPPPEIFDLEKLAKYYAMIDLFRTYHGVTWHNQRFYYNPVLSKLEPIVFDNFGETGPYRYFEKAILGNHYHNTTYVIDENIMTVNLFRDTSFVPLYIKYLEKYSEEDFVNGIYKKWGEEIEYYDSLLQIEFVNYHFNSNYLVENARKIREELPVYKKKVSESFDLRELIYSDESPAFTLTDHHEVSTEFVQAYIQSDNDSSILLRVENYYTSNILVLGTANKKKGIRNFFLPEVEVKAISGRQCGDTVVEISTRSKYMYYMIKGDPETYIIPVYAWPKPGKESPSQLLLANNKENYLNYFIEKPGKELHLESGIYQVSKPLIIPKGYKVIIEKGVQLNIINSAPFISYSTVEAIGTAEEMIIIKSSDGTANGFSVFQAPERSRIEYVVFDRLNTLDQDGWKLTGAVTFYESDVDIVHSTFQNNLCEDGLNIIRSEFIMDDCYVLNTFSDALDVDFGTGDILNTEFRYLTNDGIDVSGSLINIDNCRIMNSNDKGISGGENSRVKISNTLVLGSQIGVASKDYSEVEISDCEITDCAYGLVVFRKKPEFGGAKIKSSNLILNGVETHYLVEEGSECWIDGTSIEAESSNVYDLFY